MTDIQQGMNLSDEQVFKLIQSLNDRFNGVSTENSEEVAPNPTSFSGRVEWRRAHLHNLPAVDPKLSDPWDDGSKYQTDILRQTDMEMVARLTENPVTIDVSSPKETATTATEGDDFATVLTEIWHDVQQRLQINIQEAVSHGQVSECFGLVHWRIDPGLIPSVDDPMTLDTMPDCPMCDGTGKVKGKKCPECNGSGMEKTASKRYAKDGDKYVETAESYSDRQAQRRAAAGAPFYVELPDVAGFAFTTDRSPRPGFATCKLTRHVGILDYCDANGDEIPAEGELQPTSIEAHNPELPIGEELDAPRQWMPSWINWNRAGNEEVTIYEFWTREEYYEVVSFDGWEVPSNEAGMVLRKAFKHWYGMPPFVLVPAVVNNSGDPVLKYEPYMEGLYRIKPFIDRKMSLLDVMAEKTALPYYYWRNLQTGKPFLREDGSLQIEFSRDSALANVAPPGYELVKAEDTNIGQPFIESVRDRMKELHDARPPTGQAEVTATTQPFAIKMQQEQASIVLRSALRNQVSAYQAMIENWAHCLQLSVEQGGIGETLYVNPTIVDSNGRRITDRSKTIGVDPAIIPTLTINVNISGTSQAEQTTRTQIGVQLIDDPNVPLTRKYLLQNYFGIERPEDMLAEYRAQKIFDTEIEPGLTKQQLAKRFGGVFVVSPNGQAVGFSGQSASPYDVLGANGLKPAVPPQQPGQPQNGAPPGMSPTPGAPPPPPPVNMPAMAPLRVPGSLPVPGVPG